MLDNVTVADIGWHNRRPAGDTARGRRLSRGIWTEITAPRTHLLPADTRARRDHLRSGKTAAVSNAAVPAKARKASSPAQRERKSRGAPDPEQYFRGNSVWARLMLERFGARGRKLADYAIERTAREQVMLGMMAMDKGDREFARRCYRASIRHRPLWLKTYFRLGWAMLPTGVSRRLSPMLSPGLRRSLSGPPFLEERTQ